MQTPLPDSVLQWAARSIHEDAEISAVDQLRKESGPWALRIEHGTEATQAVLKCGPLVHWRAGYACEAAALRLAASHGLSVPRLLGEQLDRDPAALLISHVAGTTAIPKKPTAGRLRTIGRAAARLHRIPLQPTVDLPVRTRHTAWVDYSLWRRLAARYRAAPDCFDELVMCLPGWSREGAEEMLSCTESTPLLDEADERIAAHRPPVSDPVFVHGDLWQGNTLWDGDECTALIDWETAGSGHYGVDLGCLRWDAAVLFGPTAPDEILAGWEEESGRAAEDVPYWDAVSALNTPADMAAFLPSFAEAERSDLNANTINKRRDAFLEAAVARLDDRAGP